jgi:GNAT superfamily N-acetyltransferase
MKCEIISVASHNLNDAVELLKRFFQEEGFSEQIEFVEKHFKLLIETPYHWAGLALLNERPVGVVTVSSSIYVEWGRLAEIGDLYVLPEARGGGVAKTLIQASLDWCKALDCSTVEIFITQVGDERHQLTAFYEKLGFKFLDRKMGVMSLNERVVLEN